MAESYSMDGRYIQEIEAATNSCLFEFNRHLDLVFKRADVELQTLVNGVVDQSSSKRRWSYDSMRWSDRGKLTPELELDLAEMYAGYPLSRHDWLQKILEDVPEGTYPPRNTVVRAMLSRMHELTTLPERNFELEHATIELGFRKTSSPDYDGNPFTYIHVRAPEIYTRGYRFNRYGSMRSKDWGQTDREIIRSTAVGAGHIYALYSLGENIGHKGQNATRWFITYRAEGVTEDIPLDAITEVVDCSGHGSMVEYETTA